MSPYLAARSYLPFQSMGAPGVNAGAAVTPLFPASTYIARHVSLLEVRPYFTCPYLFFFADDIAGRISPLASLPVNDTPFPKGSHYFHSHLRAHAHCGFAPVRPDRLLCRLRKNCACTLYLFFLLLISAYLNSRLICSYTHML